MGFRQREPMRAFAVFAAKAGGAPMLLSSDVPAVTRVERRVVCLLPLVAYLTTASLLVFTFRVYIGDAVARVANAYFVLYSRDPHLAAVGFVWPPLPQLGLLPFVTLAQMWPALVRDGFATNIFGAVFMAASAYQMWAILRDLDVPTRQRLALFGLYTFNPMILLYGGNGMSEGPFLFFLLTSARYLAIWIRRETVTPLAVASLSLALAYLTRWEAAATAPSAAALVFAITYWRQKGAPLDRLSRALSTAVVAITPFAFIFALWAGISLLIVGRPFEPVQSVYGISAQKSVGMVVNESTAEAVDNVTRQLIGLAPALVPVAVIALITSRSRRDPGLLAFLFVIGAALAFNVLLRILGMTAEVLRYYITAVPLAVVLAGVALSSRQGRPSIGHRAPAPPNRSAVAVRVRTVTVLVLIALSYPTAAATMLEPSTGYEDSDQLRLAILGGDPRRDAPLERRHLLGGEEIARYLDDLRLPDGSVLTDTFDSYPIVLRSERPRQFVITPDRDFPSVLADPAVFGVRYILAPHPYRYGALSAITRVYPDLYDTGSGIASLVKTFSGAGPQYVWRLYAVTP